VNAALNPGSSGGGDMAAQRRGNCAADQDKHKMTSFTKLAAVTFAALLLTTSFANAGGFNFPTNDDDDDRMSTPIDIEIRHVETVATNNGHVNNMLDPHAMNNHNVNGAVLDRGQLKVALKQGSLVLDCSVGGEDLLIANAGTIDIPAGAKLKWSVKSYGAQGYVQLKRGLEAGADVRVASVLDGEAQDGTPCAVKVSGL
jgi:hypothetical protein